MGAKILVADDSITIQKVVELTFSKEDFEIIAVSNGLDAIKKAQEVRPDLLLVDVIMPQKNGYEVCEALRADPLFKDVPILLLAGTFETFDENEGRRVGANDFVTKPFESQILIGKVKQLLEEAKSRHPAIAAATAAPPMEPVAPPAMVELLVPPPPLEPLAPPLIASLAPQEETILILPREELTLEPSTEILKEEAWSPLEEEPEFHLAPEVMLEEPVTPAPSVPPVSAAEKELRKMGFWEPTPAPPALAAPPPPAPAAPEKEAEFVLLPEEPERPLFELEVLEAELKEELLYELKVEEPPQAPAVGLPEEKLWEMADLGKTELIELPPPAALAPAPAATAALELPPLDLGEFTAGEPSLEQMAAELGLEIGGVKEEAALPEAAREFRLEELMPPPLAPSPEPIMITPAEAEEAPPEIMTFETLGEAATMEIEAEEEVLRFEPEEKVEPISMAAIPAPPTFIPLVEEAPPLKAAVPMDIIPTVHELPPPAAPAALTVKEELVEEIVQRVVKELAEKILERVAWEVIPDMAELLIIKEIERIKAQIKQD